MFKNVHCTVKGYLFVLRIISSVNAHHLESGWARCCRDALSQTAVYATFSSGQAVKSYGLTGLVISRRMWVCGRISSQKTGIWRIWNSGSSFVGYPVSSLISVFLYSIRYRSSYFHICPPALDNCNLFLQIFAISVSNPFRKDAFLLICIHCSHPQEQIHVYALVYRSGFI